MRNVLCYYTVFPTQNLNQDLLIDFLLDWMEHSKNKMDGLHIEKSFPFEYAVDYKHLKIQIFDERYFTIYFSTQDNYKNTHFIVEVIYDFQEEKIHLLFSKETSNESQYISAISIPALFRHIIQSPYIQKDILPMSEKAYRVESIEEDQKKDYQMPVIYMKTRLLSAHRLAREVLGLAHVCYCSKQKEEGCIEIIYPDHRKRTYMLSKKRRYQYQIYEINEILRNEMIHKYQDSMPSYEQLYQKQIYSQQTSTIKNTKEYQEEFEKEIQRQQQEVNELKNLYEMLLQEQHKEQEKNQKLVKMKEAYASPLLSIDDMSKVVPYQKCLLQYIRQKAMNLDSTHEIYRRLDILLTILEANGGQL